MGLDFSTALLTFSLCAHAATRGLVLVLLCIVTFLLGEAMCLCCSCLAAQGKPRPDGSTTMSQGRVSLRSVLASTSPIEEDRRWLKRLNRVGFVDCTVVILADLASTWRAHRCLSIRLAAVE